MISIQGRVNIQPDHSYVPVWTRPKLPTCVEKIKATYVGGPDHSYQPVWSQLTLTIILCIQVRMNVRTDQSYLPMWRQIKATTWTEQAVLVNHLMHSRHSEHQDQIKATCLPVWRQIIATYLYGASPPCQSSHQWPPGCWSSPASSVVRPCSTPPAPPVWQAAPSPHPPTATAGTAYQKVSTFYPTPVNLTKKS